MMQRMIKRQVAVSPDMPGDRRASSRLLPLRSLMSLLVLLMMIAAPSVQAQEATGQPYIAPGAHESLLTDPADKERYNSLAQELRCLVCQNQTLADSDASLATDLRRQVETMVKEGQSDAQIKSYLVDRYGDFVLYRPPVQSNTWLLWFGPFVLFAIGFMVWRRMQFRRLMTAPVGASSPNVRTPPSRPAGAARPPATRSAANAEAQASATALAPDPEDPPPAELARARRLLDG